MARVIKFRGLRANGNGWVYGYIQPHTNPELLDILQLNDDHDWTRYRVKPETVGQFTGLKDKNGIEIYEGDRVNSGYFKDCIVVFWNSGWHFKSDAHSHHSFNTAKHSFEVIGNIHTKEVKNG